MTARRLRAALLAAAVLFLLAAGCGRKARPEPRSALPPPLPAPYDIAFTR